MSGLSSLLLALLLAACGGAEPRLEEPTATGTAGTLEVFGGRGGHRNLRAATGSPIRGAVDLGLEWLSARQAEDGSFDTEDRDVTGTSLALLAYLGAGETPEHGRYRPVVKKAAEWLRQIQDPEGVFGPRDRPNWLHAHAIATLAMAEIQGLTGSPHFETNVQRAVDFLAANIGEAPDASILPWFVAALHSAKSAGLRVPESALELSRERYDAGADLPDAAPYPPSSSRAATAAEALARLFLGENPGKSRKLVALLDEVGSTAPARDDPDMVAVCLGTFAEFQNGGESWKRWNGALKDALTSTQARDGENAGSWEPRGEDAEKLGRVGTTALATLCFEVYYAYNRTFGAR